MRFLRRPRDAAGRINEDWQPRVYGRLIVLALLIAYVVAFIFENTKHVAVHFVVFTTHVSIVWLILLNLVLGAVGGILLAQLERRRRRRRAAQ
ncbi:MAG TPA: lipopolysaccharide assembly protein LapA domain-containing protein [Gaiellaceae bacterium]|nr:lipopolysaccharide assembly protein LapA domain-containing protein [Gaiellaceae bacterium]